MLDDPDRSKRRAVEDVLRETPGFRLQGEAANALLAALKLDFSDVFDKKELDGLRVSLPTGSGGQPIPNPSPELAAAGFALGCVCFPFWGCFYW